MWNCSCVFLKCQKVIVIASITSESQWRDQVPGSGSFINFIHVDSLYIQSVVDSHLIRTSKLCCYLSQVDESILRCDLIRLLRAAGDPHRPVVCVNMPLSCDGWGTEPNREQKENQPNSHPAWKSQGKKQELFSEQRGSESSPSCPETAVTSSLLHTAEGADEQQHVSCLAATDLKWNIYCYTLCSFLWC